jgi:hypothetical protein
MPQIMSDSQSLGIVHNGHSLLPNNETQCPITLN